MAERPPADDRGSPQTAAAYIADMTSDLARIARRHGFATLGYILDMAHVEAESTAGRGRDRANGAPPR